MKKILIANPKGGCGKSTLATNLAGYFASIGEKVALLDLDRQQSAIKWLKRRPKFMPRIYEYNYPIKTALPEVNWLIIDTPAGIGDSKISVMAKNSNLIIIPIQPSAFDIGVTKDFLDILQKEKAIRKFKTFVGLVGMRVNYRTNATAKLIDYMHETGIPELACLRNAQVYESAAELGLSLFDLRPTFVSQDIEQWVPLLEWVGEMTNKNI